MAQPDKKPNSSAGHGLDSPGQTTRFGGKENQSLRASEAGKRVSWLRPHGKWPIRVRMANDGFSPWKRGARAVRLSSNSPFILNLALPDHRWAISTVEPHPVGPKPCINTIQTTSNARGPRPAVNQPSELVTLSRDSVGSEDLPLAQTRGARLAQSTRSGASPDYRLPPSDESVATPTPAGSTYQLSPLNSVGPVPLSLTDRFLPAPRPAARSGSVRIRYGDAGNFLDKGLARDRYQPDPVPYAPVFWGVGLPAPSGVAVASGAGESSSYGIPGYTGTRQDCDDIIRLYREYGDRMLAVHNKLPDTRNIMGSEESNRILRILREAEDEGLIVLNPRHTLRELSLKVERRNFSTPIRPVRRERAFTGESEQDNSTAEESPDRNPYPPSTRRDAIFKYHPRYGGLRLPGSLRQEQPATRLDDSAEESPARNLFSSWNARDAIPEYHPQCSGLELPSPQRQYIRTGESPARNPHSPYNERDLMPGYPPGPGGRLPSFRRQYSSADKESPARNQFPPSARRDAIPEYHPRYGGLRLPDWPQEQHAQRPDYITEEESPARNPRSPCDERDAVPEHQSQYGGLRLPGWRRQEPPAQRPRYTTEEESPTRTLHPTCNERDAMPGHHPQYGGLRFPGWGRQKPPAKRPRVYYGSSDDYHGLPVVDTLNT